MKPQSLYLPAFTLFVLICTHVFAEDASSQTDIGFSVSLPFEVNIGDSTQVSDPQDIDEYNTIVDVSNDEDYSAGEVYDPESYYPYYAVDQSETSPGDVNIVFDQPQDSFSFGFYTSSPGPAYDTSVDDASTHSATDASVASAQSAFMATPHSNEYQQRAYEAFTAVRMNCKQDYAEICAAPQFSPFKSALGDLLGGLFMSHVLSTMTMPLSLGQQAGRRLMDLPAEAQPHPIVALTSKMFPRLDAMASKFAAFRDEFKQRAASPSSLIAPRPVPKAFPGAGAGAGASHLASGEMGPMGRMRLAVMDRDSTSSVKQQLRGSSSENNVRLLQGFDKPLPPPPPGFPFGMSPPPPKGAPQGPPNPGSDQPSKPCHHDHGHDHDHDHSHQNSGYRANAGSAVPPPEHQPGEDFSFTGELLWGPQGDDCMYLNYEKLSSNCQNAIYDVYALRQQYWGEEEQGHHSHGVIFLVLFVLLAMVAGRLCCNRGWRARMKNVRTVYSALEANPELKAQVEAAAGVAVEPLPTKKSFGCVMLSVLCYIGLGFLVWIAAALITW